MDHDSFDAFTRLAGRATTRRGVGTLAAGVAGLFALDHDAESKKKEKKEKEKVRLVWWSVLRRCLWFIMLIAREW